MNRDCFVGKDVIAELLAMTVYIWHIKCNFLLYILLYSLYNEFRNIAQTEVLWGEGELFPSSPPNTDD